MGLLHGNVCTAEYLTVFIYIYLIKRGFLWVSSYLIITLCFHLLQLDIPLYAFIDNISCTKFIVNETYFNNLVLPLFIRKVV